MRYESEFNETLILPINKLLAFEEIADMNTSKEEYNYFYMYRSGEIIQVNNISVHSAIYHLEIISKRPDTLLNHLLLFGLYDDEFSFSK